MIPVLAGALAGMPHGLTNKKRPGARVGRTGANRWERGRRSTGSDDGEDGSTAASAAAMEIGR